MSTLVKPSKLGGVSGIGSGDVGLPPSFLLNPATLSDVYGNVAEALSIPSNRTMINVIDVTTTRLESVPANVQRVSGHRVVEILFQFTEDMVAGAYAKVNGSTIDSPTQVTFSTNPVSKV